jgi:hypothetical protein
MGLLWDQDKLITLTECNINQTFYLIGCLLKFQMCFGVVGIIDHNIQMITLTMITLRGFHCNVFLFVNLYIKSYVCFLLSFGGSDQ